MCKLSADPDRYVLTVTPHNVLDTRLTHTQSDHVQALAQLQTAIRWIADELRLEVSQAAFKFKGWHCRNDRYDTVRTLPGPGLGQHCTWYMYMDPHVYGT